MALGLFAPFARLASFPPLRSRADDDGFEAMMLVRIEEPTLNREVEFLAAV